MSITFQKRQKEIKRQEKQRAKAEKRAQKRVTRRAAKDPSGIGAFTATTSLSESERADSIKLASNDSGQEATVAWPR